MSTTDDEEQLDGVCHVCYNSYSLLTNPAKRTRHCPFCQVQVWPALPSPRPKLDDVIGLRIVRHVDWEGSGVEDGPLLEDLDMVSLLAQSDGLDESEVLRGCRSSTWHSDGTWACVSVRPTVGGNRMVTATVQSTRHDHLLPNPSE